MKSSRFLRWELHSLKTLDIGEISEPVKTQFGLHLIQLEDKKVEHIKPFAEVKEELERNLRKEKADSLFYEQVDQFANLAFEHPNTLSILIDNLNLTLQSTGLFERTTHTEEGILSHPAVITAAFKEAVLKEGFNSEVVDIGEQHVVVLRIKDHEPAQPRPLTEVKENIITTVKQQKSQKAAEQQGQQILTKIEQGEIPQQIDITPFSWSAAQWIARNDKQVNQQKIVQQAFKMGQPPEDKAIYQGISLDSGDYVIIAVLATKTSEQVKKDFGIL